MITLAYDCYSEGERKNFTNTFETKEEIEQFLLKSSDEVWISLSSLKMDGKPVEIKITLVSQ